MFTFHRFTLEQAVRCEIRLRVPRASTMELQRVQIKAKQSGRLLVTVAIWTAAMPPTGHPLAVTDLILLLPGGVLRG